MAQAVLQNSSNVMAHLAGGHRMIVLAGGGKSVGLSGGVPMLVPRLQMVQRRKFSVGGRRSSLEQQKQSRRLGSQGSGGVVCSLNEASSTSGPAVYQGMYGPWSVEAEDVREVTAVYAAGNAAGMQQGRYQRVGECLVFPPFPISMKPKAIIKFLGGAFIGASPDITYSYFIDLLAKEGFVIVATPYNVTFDHAVSASRIYRKFNDTLSILYDYGVPLLRLFPDDLSNLPIYSVGHSNGALMQVLIGSLCTELPGQLPKANAIISFNNKPASDAVPFFEQMGPTLVQAAPLVEASPLTSIAANFAAEAIKVVRNNPIPLPPGVSNDDLQSVQQFFEQIPGVFDQVAKGVSEFTPSPAQNRETIKVRYAIPNNLLIKFTDDTIDEADRVEDSLKLRSEILGGSFKKLILAGTHATPLAQDPKWKVGNVFTPVDAVAQALRLAALADLRNLAKRTADWFDSLS